MRREFGGCAGNIGYNLKLLGGEPLVMATVGADADPYLQRLDDLGMNRSHVKKLDEAFTAQAMITTDMANNQITAFHPGAMNHSHLNRVTDCLSTLGSASPHFGIVAPDGRLGMWEHCHQFVEAGVPFMFDPGQGLPMFNGQELLELVKLASYVAVNDYEGEMLCQRTGLPLEQIAKEVKALIVTKGAQGAQIYADGKSIAIPAVRPEKVIDPTGCGDAFRGGLLYGLENKLDWETTGRLASLMGSIKIAHQGPQNHQPPRSEIMARFKDAFGYSF
jgi:adenosine kinase